MSARPKIEPRQRRAALLVAGCLFMELLDGTIVTTSAPQIARSLAVSPASVGLLITAYFVTVAALMPASGWVSARFGARPVFLGAIALFAAASLGCALSMSLPELVVMRVLQGAGGAMMLPVGRLVVLARAAKEDLVTITAYLIWPALLAPVIAPLAGGAITTYANWHWLFLVNLPIAAIGLVVAARLIESPPREPRTQFDRVGFALTCVGLGGAAWVAGLLSAARPDWAPIAAAAAGCAVVLLVAVRHLLRAAQPLMNLRTLRIPTFGAAVGGLALFALAVAAAPFVLSLFFQEAFRWSAVKSGSLVLFLFVGNIAIKPVGTFLLSRRGVRGILVAATSGMAATLVAVAFVRISTPIPVIAAILLVSGVARSIGGTGYTTVAFTDVPEREMRDANTLQATAQQLSLGMGVAVGTIALRAGDPLGRLVLGSAHGTSSYSVAFVLLALVSLGAMVVASRLHPSAGSVLRRSGPHDESRPAVAQAGEQI